MVLDAREPFPANALVTFLTRRAIPGVESVSADGTYHRILDLAHGPTTVALTPHARGVSAVFGLSDEVGS